MSEDFIIRNGEVDHHIFFLRSGLAAVYVGVEPPSWHSEAVRYFTGGDSFGEVSVLASTPRTAWIMARSYCISTKAGRRLNRKGFSGVIFRWFSPAACGEVHSSSLMTVLHSHPGSFLLLVKNLLQYQELS